MTMQRGTKARGRRGLTVAAAAVAAAAGIGLAVPALAAPGQPAPSQPAQGQPGGAASAPILGAGQVGGRAAVPWAKVGPGWSLVMYSAAQGGEGIKAKAGPMTLYLVDPSGGRYRMFTWSAHSRQTQWQLIAWSGDSRRAIFVPNDELYNSVREQVFQLQLRSGAITSFTLPANVTAVGYTRPDGLNILAEQGAGRSPGAIGTLMRFSLTGQRQKTLATVRGLGNVAYQPAGLELAAGSQNGITLVSNEGGVIRRLTVPGVPGVHGGCGAVRWWTASTILATCAVSNEPGPRLWLVSVGGARPAALTPARKGDSFDQGDFNAWQLSAGLYVDGVGACGTLVIGRQPAHGAEQMVSVPGAASSLIYTATRTRLLVERLNGCSPGASLVWLNPATHKMTVAVPVHGLQWGVVGVVPYFVAGKF
jgi:hypothetical protein